MDEHLWTAIARETGGRSNTTSLVGTPEQVANALLRYYDLGITTFLIRGFDPLLDAIAYGRTCLWCAPKWPSAKQSVRPNPQNGRQRKRWHSDFFCRPLR